MSYMERSDVRSMNDDAKFGDKETRRKFAIQVGSQDVNAIDQVADGAFMESPALVPVNQEEFGRCKRERKLTQKGSMKFHSWKRSNEN